MVTKSITRHSSLGRLPSSIDYKFINTSDQCVNDTVVCSTTNVFYLHQHDFQVKDVKVPCCSVYLKQTNQPLLPLLLACFTSHRAARLSWPADSSAECLISCLSWVTAEWELLSCVMGLAFPHHSRRAHCERGIVLFMATSQTQTLGKLNWPKINKQTQFWQNLGFALLEISL